MVQSTKVSPINNPNPKPNLFRCCISALHQLLIFLILHSEFYRSQAVAESCSCSL